MREEWKDITGYEGLYQVSNTGKVKSLERTIWNSGRGCYRTVPERILKAKSNCNGYITVQLYKEGKKKYCRINRLVAIAFIPNPDNLPEVNHKDKIRTNNCVQNLEWCTKQYNIEYSKAKAVIGINKVSGLIVEFPSAYEAERVLSVTHQNVCACCNGKLKSAKGYYWMYADESEEVANEQE